MNIAVIGAGISGLAAAVAAKERGTGSDRVVVFEREAEVGGRARSECREGFLVERGPNAFLGRDDVVRDLARRAGLTPREAQPSGRRRLLFRAGSLREVRPHPLSLLRHGILSPAGLVRALTEPWRGPADRMESVAEFARRRFGRQVAERLFAPMVSGVFAGDCDRLELQSCFPQLAEWERSPGSVVRGVMRHRREPGGRDAGRLYSFEGGMGALSRALVRAEAIEVQTGADVRSLHPNPGGGYRLRVGEEDLQFERVVLATDLPHTSKLLVPCAPDAAAELAEVVCPPLVVVALGYRQRPAALPPAYGALVLRGEGVTALGCLFESELFTGRAPAGGALVRAMLGGRIDPSSAEGEDETLVGRAHRDLQRLLGRPTPAPDFSSVVRWPAAIPQYELGHAERVRRVEQDLDRVPGLEIAGNCLGGVAFGKAAARGWAVGCRVARPGAAS